MLEIASSEKIEGVEYVEIEEFMTGFKTLIPVQCLKDLDIKKIPDIIVRNVCLK